MLGPRPPGPPGQPGRPRAWVASGWKTTSRMSAPPCDSCGRRPVVWGADLGALLALQSAVQFPPRAIVCSTPLLPRSWLPDARPPLPLVRCCPPCRPCCGAGHCRPPDPASPASSCSPASPPTFRPSWGGNSSPIPAVSPGTLSREGRGPLSARLSDPGRSRRGGPHECAGRPARPWCVSWRQTSTPIPPAATGCTAAQAALSLVGDVHRWIIRTLGEPLLVPPEEED